jgi:Domain of unknown function (DUF4381)
MGDPTPSLDPSVRAALERLTDIVAPPPVSFVPQTWGWAALAAIVFVLAVWGFLRWRRYREANRYRAEALAELARIERTITAGPDPAEALAAIPPLLKRVALAAWPRSRVASLAQTSWVEFLRVSESHSTLPTPLAKLLDDIEYRSANGLAAISADDARACVEVARYWIEAHRVSA